MESSIRNLLIKAMPHLNEKLKKRFISYNQKTEEFTLYPEKIPKGRLIDVIKEWSEIVHIEDFPER